MDCETHAIQAPLAPCIGCAPGEGQRLDELGQQRGGGSLDRVAFLEAVAGDVVEVEADQDFLRVDRKIVQTVFRWARIS